MSESEETTSTHAKEEEDTTISQEDEKTADDSKNAEESDSETEKPKSETPEQKKDSKSPKKKTEKPKVDEEDDDEEEDEEEEEDGEPKLGLLERPVVLETGAKRQKKKVERLDISSSSTPKEKKKFEITEGSGDKLGDSPWVEYQLGKHKAEELKPLHRLLFNTPGTSNLIRKNIRQFSGFSFDKSDKEYEKKQGALNKLHVPILKLICEIVDLEKKGTKEDIVDRIMTFCLKPHSSERKVPGKKKKIYRWWWWW